MIKKNQISYCKYLLKYNLQFFADKGDKTEEPTTKKLSDARGEGRTARSTEIVSAAGLLTLFVILKLYVGYYGQQFINSFIYVFNNIEKFACEDFTVNMAGSILSEEIKRIIFTCLPVFLITIVVSIVVILFQVKWRLTPNLLKPKLSNISLIGGFKRIFSKDKVVQLIFENIKIVAICYIAYTTLKNQWSLLFELYDMKLEKAIILIGNIIINLGMKISMIFLVIGFADLIYQKIKFKNDMKMSKQEVKDEYKNSEGDPQIKSKIRAKMREVSMQRMMQSLPKADVVITNPTHFAAAIKYDKETSAAPILLAKGADYLAQKIKEAARENNIEIVENKPLARMLYYNVEIGAEIPPELYQMTAEVLAYVYGLKNKI